MYELLKLAFSSLRANKLRSALTVLGIVVGIFSIISISTVISMLQKSIEEGVSALNSNTFQIQKWPSVRTGGPGSWAKYRNRKDITIEEYYELKQRLTETQNVGAEQWNFGRLLKYRGEETNPNVSVGGITPEGFLNNDWVIARGRDINSRDMESSSNVIVLGPDIVEALFKKIDPLGQEIAFDGKKLTVIGILESKGDFFGQSQDNFALIPHTTYQSLYGKRGRSVNITVRADDERVYKDLIEKAVGHMRVIRKVAPGEENDFEIRTNENVLSQINDITSGVRIGAIVIGAIALLAAGVGIMNIMLVSVTERTREIGIRKAIGARKSNILSQFLFEAIALCLFGGAIGIVLGVMVGNLAGSLLNATATIPMDWVGIGVLLCVLIGITFGTYPAFKASNLDPIEALRYE
ncbi:MAG: ABC transporter permease [Ignavibacteriales bacterium]|nr:ABC transporter permease [Ignavibacteriales bacterium]MCF8314774.1 ABC transporter permease [Ignavibacteriales bacterium]MCF8437978.1 ABC transporter permease [Ignavibacteriales bacterium]